MPKKTYDPNNIKIIIKYINRMINICQRWVPFVLFLQAMMFYLPHIIYEMAEGKKVFYLKNIMFIVLI